MKTNFINKLLTASLALTLVIGISACGSSSNTADNASSQNETATESDSISDSTQVSDSLSDDDYSKEIYLSEDNDNTYVGSVSAKTAVNESLYNQLKKINASIQVGAAGSTIAAEGCANALINWGKKTTSSKSVIENTVESFMDELTKADKKIFKEQLTMVDESYKELSSNTIKNVEYVMKKAGIRKNSSDKSKAFVSENRH